MASILLLFLGMVAIATSVPLSGSADGPLKDHDPLPVKQEDRPVKDHDPLPAENKQADAGVEQFLKDMVNKINRYRLMHAAKPLRLDLDLTNKAELWAVKIANNDKEELNNNVSYGQAIYSSANAIDIVNSSVESWYNQIVHYKYYRPQAEPKNNYFTQLVWTDTSDIGIGKAQSGSGKTYIVAFFDPPADHDVSQMYLKVHPVTGSGVGKIGPSQCTDDYQFFNNSCWKLFPGPRTWESAVHKCTQQYASLATVDSEAENSFIKTLLTSSQKNLTWIGLGDLDDDQTFAWVDGSPHWYTKWDPIQDPKQGRQCAILGIDFEWRYVSCDKGNSFVCKRKLRDLSAYELEFRYMDKLWTDKLLYPGENRYRALKTNLETSIFEVYREDDWFNELRFLGFSKGDQDKILATVRISFTPDDDAPLDPIEKLRNKLRGNSAPVVSDSVSQRRSTIKGVLFGEPVELIQVKLVIDSSAPACPNYCAAQQCQPTACSPSCCTAQYGGYTGYPYAQTSGYTGYPYQGYPGYGSQAYVGYQGYQANRYPSYSGYPGYARSIGYNNRYPGYSSNPGYSGYPGNSAYHDYHSSTNVAKQPKKKSKPSNSNDDDVGPPPIEQSKPQIKQPSPPAQNKQQRQQQYQQQQQPYNPFVQQQQQQPYYNQQYNNYGQFAAPSYGYNSPYNPYARYMYPPSSGYQGYLQAGYPRPSSTGYPGSRASGSQGYTGYTNQPSPALKASKPGDNKKNNPKQPTPPPINPMRPRLFNPSVYNSYSQGYPQPSYGYPVQSYASPYQISGAMNGYQYSMSTGACLGACANSCAPQCSPRCCARSHVRPREHGYLKH